MSKPLLLEIPVLHIDGEVNSNIFADINFHEKGIVITLSKQSLGNEITYPKQSRKFNLMNELSSMMYALCESNLYLILDECTAMMMNENLEDEANENSDLPIIHRQISSLSDY